MSYNKKFAMHPKTSKEKQVCPYNRHSSELPQWLSGKEPVCNAGDPGDAGSVPGLGRSPVEGNGNPLQYSCLENPMEGGAWQATVHGVAKSRTRLSDFTILYMQGTHTSVCMYVCVCVCVCV